MDLAELSDEELVESVLTWAARVARGEAELCARIGELDARSAWAQDGVVSCAHWLSWKLGWSATTARERVRVGRALRDLPLISEAFAAGRVTYCQVRAITRVASADDEDHWLSLARHCTGAQLDKAARGAARAIAADRDADGHADQVPHKGPAVRKDWDSDGDLILTLRIPAHQAVPVLIALEQHQAAEQAEREQAVAALLAGLGSGASAEAPSSDAQLELVAADPDDPEPEPEPAIDPEIDLGAVPAARWADPMREYPYVEPDYPICGSTPVWMQSPQQRERENTLLRDWQQRCRSERAIQHAWNTRRERLLNAAAAQQVPTGRASLADALVRAVLRPTDCPPVTVQLLHDPVSGWARTPHDELLPPATLTQVLRSLPVRRSRRGPLALPRTTAEQPAGRRVDLAAAAQAHQDLTRHDLGRSSRLASTALRRLLGALDGERCRFPGCPSTRHLHAHHVQFWSNDGPTDLANMILLCSRHHQLLHNAGYTLTLDPRRQLTVTTPTGTVLKHLPEHRNASAEALPPAHPGTLDRAYRGDPFDLGYVVDVMLQHAA